MHLSRRRLIASLGAALLLPGGVRRARAATARDATGRDLTLPAKVERVFPAGPPAAILLYTLAPALLLGWPRPNRPEERAFLLPDVGGRSNPAGRVGDVPGRRQRH